MRNLAIVTSLMILGIATNVEAEPFQFKNYQASYTLRYDGIPFGTSTTTFNTDEKNHYILCIDNKSTLSFLQGTVKECSAGIVTPHTVKPLTYDYDYTRNQEHQHIHIDFDWKKNIATMTTGTTRWHIDIPPTTQDKISYQLLIRRGLSQGQTDFSFPIADGGKLKTYEFNVKKSQNNVITLDRAPMPSKENVTLWLRSDIDYIIAKVKQNKHIADVGTAELTSFHWKNNA